MKIIAFSDLHLAAARAEAIVATSADADLVVAAGDFCNARQDLNRAMALLSGITAPVFAVPGNAESFEELQAARLPNMTVLHGTGTRLGALRVFGLGYAVPETPFGQWSCDLSEDDAAEMLARCDAADLLILHSPPKGVADRTSGGVSVGSTAIRAAIERLQPRLAVCGHIHDSWGLEGTIRTTRIVNLGPFPTRFDWVP